MRTSVFAALAATMLSGAAHAATLHYSYVPATDPNGPFSFSLDTASPTYVLDDSTFLVQIAGASGTVAGNDAVAFYAASSPGGLDGGVAQYSGPQLFTGSLSDPTYLLGVFDLTDQDAGPGFGGAGVLTVTASAAGSVPEPASWVLMIAGFGAVGYAMRRRRVSVRFA